MRRILNKSVGNTLQPLIKYVRPVSYNYWRPDFRVCLAAVHDLDQYFLDFTPKAEYAGPFDSNGIPLTNYGTFVGTHYYPINVAQYGLGAFERWRQSPSNEDWQRFVLVADWLVAQQESQPPLIGSWLTRFDWLGIRAPWPSAMAQGQGVSMLVRAHRATGDQRYLDSAVRAVRAMAVRSADGGTLLPLGSDAAFFEELPGMPPSSVLNGHLFALWGLVDLARSGADVSGAAAELRDLGIKGLERMLPNYDLGFWSRYDLSRFFIPNPASAFYHEMHVRQLTVTAELFDSDVCRHFASKWAGYERRPWYRAAALVLKVGHKVGRY